MPGRKSEPPVLSLPHIAVQSLATAIHCLAEQFRRYNDKNEPKVSIAGEAEFFKATYTREDEGTRELKEMLRGIEPKEAENRVGRAPAVEDGGGKKKARGGRGPKK